MIILLLDRGAVLHPKATEGDSPLYWVAFAGDFKATKLLLDRGADPHATTGYSGSPLFAAARSGDYETTKMLLERGSEVNRNDASYYTPLHGAVLAARPKVVKLLLEHGAVVDLKKNPVMGTVLMDAKQTGNREILNMLDDALAWQQKEANRKQ